VVKPILQLYPVLAAESEDEREALRPLGRNVERYQDALTGMNDLVRAADELGFWGVSSVEHHFHSEGYEVGPTPGLLAAHWAAITENVRVGELGYTMSAQNPIRVAEETAVIDHLTRGRCFVGFSRGYQSRWTNVLGQHIGTRATLSPNGASEEARALMDAERFAALVADDQANRRVFEEQVDLVHAAWTQESIQHRGETWQIPFPYDEGVEWEMSEVTARLGAHGEIGPNGNVHRVSVTPAPYTNPHPPVFVASNASQETVEYCARRGFIPTYFSPIAKAAKFGRAYVEAANAAGHDVRLGEKQALVRWLQIADTTEEAHAGVLAHDAEVFKNLYAPLLPKGGIGFDERDPVGSVIRSGLWAAGSIEEVRNQLVDEFTQLPAEHLVLITHFAQEPKESVIRQMQLFVEHIKPALDELTDAHLATATL
jgi:alkanesulfonate monooxygenase SsuD/methylene tetrahydromethanopterin reductase-like flavin-dependent oxidoreductase (luciferase family)